MTTPDPNADLRGYTLPVETGGVGVVLGTARWNPAYVELDTPAGRTVRVAAQVRRRKELLSHDGATEDVRRGAGER